VMMEVKEEVLMEVKEEELVEVKEMNDSITLAVARLLFRTLCPT
jgi:hypothetical protein